ncbi:MAG: hypothetical protein AAGJ28_01295 [Pseudomonadota bacterium]
MSSAAKKNSSKLTERDKDLYTVIICLLIICPYVFLFYGDSRSELQHAENMINRKLNRIEARTAAPEPPAVSQRDLEADLADVKERRDALLRRVSAGDEKFASLETVDDLKRLRLEVTHLAEWSGVSLLKFGDLRDTELADSASYLKTVTDNEFHRPVMSLVAVSDFGRLSKFIAGLSKLSKNVAIVRFSLSAPEFDTDPESVVATPELTATLELAL